jgi:opacity protein-like surface antigen
MLIYVSTINASFHYGIEAINTLTALVGFNMGYVVDVNFGDLEVTDYNKEQFGWVAGLSFDARENIKIEARYTPAINEQIFRYTILFGIHYSIGE